MRISEILNSKRGALQLSDIIESEGKKEVQRIIRADIATIVSEANEVEKQVAQVKETMKLYEDDVRKKAITKRFRELMRDFLFKLEVHTLNYEKLLVYSNVSETGSDLPRALLAYYYSILYLMKDFSTAAFCPIIIDSPNQQDQDLANLKNMLVFIRDQRPPESQIIVGLVDDCGIKFEGEVIELTDKYHLLQESGYEDLANDVRDLLNKSRSKSG